MRRSPHLRFLSAACFLGLTGGAFAAGEPCLIAGWQGTRTASGCFSREYAESARKCATSSSHSIACNPEWFGTTDRGGGNTACIERPNHSRWTATCLRESLKRTRDRGLVRMKEDLATRIYLLDAGMNDLKKRQDTKKKDTEAKQNLLQNQFRSLSQDESFLAGLRRDLQQLRKKERAEKERALREAIAGHERIVARDRNDIVDTLLGPRGGGSEKERAEWLEKLEERSLAYDYDHPSMAAELDLMRRPFDQELERSIETSFRTTVRAQSVEADRLKELDDQIKRWEKNPLDADAVFADDATLAEVREQWLAELEETPAQRKAQIQKLDRACAELRIPQDRKDCFGLTTLYGGTAEIRAARPLDAGLRSCSTLSVPLVSVTVERLHQDVLETEAFEARDSLPTAEKH